MITRKSLSRRTLLRGIGTVVGLPLLDAMMPAFAGPVQKGGKAPCRMLIHYLPNGIIMKDWTPATEGVLSALPRTLEPLAPHRDKMLMLTGLKRYNSFAAVDDGAGAHARTGASYLTGVGVRKNGGNDLYVGTSMDQIAAQHIGKQTRFASLELSCEDGRMVGSCDPPYACVYNNHISWRSATTPNAPEVSPRALFERLFGPGDEDAPTRARFKEFERGILDGVLEDSRRLANKLGPSDRRKLDEYMTSIREVELRIQKAETGNSELTPTIEKPASTPADLVEHLNLMYDMLTIAFQTDSTRIATLMIGREASVRTYREIGIPESHHPMTHHKGDATLIEKVAKIDRYHMELFSSFVGKLAGTPDGDGSLLDHMIILNGAGMSDGNSHSNSGVPTMVVGGGCGTVKLGRHVKVAAATPLTNLYVSMLQRMGVPAEKFGDSTGELKELSELT